MLNPLPAAGFLLLSLPLAVSAQFDFGGSCLDAPVEMTVDPGQPTLNGKPFYIGSGDFTEPGQPTETLNFEVYWDVSVAPSAWVFANGGFIIAENDDDTPEPPLSTASAWLILTSGPETCPSNALTVAQSGAVPVTWVRLSAKRTAATLTVVTWATATETDNRGFSVERRAGGEAWRPIGFVAGAGDADALQSYAFADAHAPAEATYYRLRQIDGDGTEAVSEVVAVGPADVLAPRLTVAPNPSDGSVTLRGASTGSDVGVYDPLGRLVYAARAMEAAQVLPLRHLPAGAYVAVATDLSGTIQHVSLVIQ